MSSPLYPNQPLVEVATEVRFKGDLTIESVRAEFQKKLYETYPNLLIPVAQEGIAPPLQPYRFEKEDRATGVQLAINSFSYYSRNYPGHDLFLSEIESVITILSKLHTSFEVTRIGWRYINSIPFSREDDFIPLHRFFKDNEYLGNTLSIPSRSISFKTLIPRDRNLVNISVESAESTQMPGIETILLDIDAFEVIQSPTTTELPSLIDKLKELHSKGYEVFENLISDNYREFLKGESNDG